MSTVLVDQKHTISANPCIFLRSTQITCGCAVGTIKSRVNRARTRLAELLSIDSADEFGPDEQTRAVLAGGRE